MWVKDEVGISRSHESSHMHDRMNPDALTQCNAIVLSGLESCRVKHFSKGPYWQPCDGLQAVFELYKCWRRYNQNVFYSLKNILKLPIETSKCNYKIAML